MTSLLAAALATAAAAGGDFVPVREDAGCALAMRDPSHPEGAAMRAECTWPEVDPAHLVAMLSVFEDYPRFVFPIDEASVVRREDGRALVYQRQSMFGLADREVLLWMVREDTADGGVRFAWVAAADEPLALRPGAVRTPRNTGSWTVTPAPGGGAAVVHEIALDAGGFVPRWIVDLVRTRAFARIMADVRAAAAP